MNGTGTAGAIDCTSQVLLALMVSPVVLCIQRVELIRKHPFVGKLTVELLGRLLSQWREDQRCQPPSSQL